jgi:hypothetical protein
MKYDLMILKVFFLHVRYSLDWVKWYLLDIQQISTEGDVMALRLKHHHVFGLIRRHGDASKSKKIGG